MPTPDLQLPEQGTRARLNSGALVTPELFADAGMDVAPGYGVHTHIITRPSTEPAKPDPGVRIVLATGFSRRDLDDLLRIPNVRGFLQKPFKLQEPADLLQGCLD